MEEKMPDDFQPAPEERRRLLATIPLDTGSALRLVSAFADGDAADAKAVIDDVIASEASADPVSGHHRPHRCG
jgi:hypothetical protein